MQGCKLATHPVARMGRVRWLDAQVKQDLLIDKINEEIKSLTERKAIYEAQLVAQKQETEAAVRDLVDCCSSTFLPAPLFLGL